jgi:rRNA maturation endonuclease Nob1
MSIIAKHNGVHIQDPTRIFELVMDYGICVLGPTEEKHDFQCEYCKTNYLTFQSNCNNCGGTIIKIYEHQRKKLAEGKINGIQST